MLAVDGRRSPATFRVCDPGTFTQSCQRRQRPGALPAPWQATAVVTRPARATMCDGDRHNIDVFELRANTEADLHLITSALPCPRSNGRGSSQALNTVIGTKSRRPLIAGLLARRHDERDSQPSRAAPLACDLCSTFSTTTACPHAFPIGNAPVAQQGDLPCCKSLPRCADVAALQWRHCNTSPLPCDRPLHFRTFSQRTSLVK